MTAKVVPIAKPPIPPTSPNSNALSRKIRKTRPGLSPQGHQCPDLATSFEHVGIHVVRDAGSANNHDDDQEDH